MMKLIIMIIFLIPLLNNWWIFMLSLMLITFNFIYLTFYMNFWGMISHVFGIDLISYYLVSLTMWIMFLMVLASYIIYLNKQNINEFLIIMIFMLITLIFTFSVDNLLMFYISFESSLIPTLFLIFGWGYQPERLSASYYLLFYTLVASLPLLLGLFYISFESSLTLSFWLIFSDMNVYLYLSLIIAFLVKMPMMFVHFWLPKAHVEAPISGSMILAGVLLKMGGYGLYRMFSFMDGYCKNLNYLWLSLSLFSIFMVGFLCLYQTDIKAMIAYSSVAHMGLVICSIMTLNIYGFMGSLILMLGHAFCSSGLFCLANFIYERTHSRSLLINKGVITLMPSFSFMFFMLCINNMASPPSLNLLGEIYIINSLLGWDSFTCILLMLGSFMSCCYSIYLYSITQHGNIYNGNGILTSITIREYILFLYHWIPLNLLLFKLDYVSFCL